MRLAEFKNVTGKSTLYVARSLVNHEEVLAWAGEQGFGQTMPADSLHVTIAYSKQPVDWSLTTPEQGALTFSGGTRRVEPLGDKGAVVLRFAAPSLKRRWQALRDDLGCSWDYPGYKAHLTLTYKAGDLDLAGVMPYVGRLVFGPEKFEEIDNSWQTTTREKAPSETAEAS